MGTRSLGRRIIGRMRGSLRDAATAAVAARPPYPMLTSSQSLVSATR